jgi:hypothetical protein
MTSCIIFFAFGLANSANMPKMRIYDKDNCHKLLCDGNYLFTGYLRIRLRVSLVTPRYEATICKGSRLKMVGGFSINCKYFSSAELLIEVKILF